MRYSEGMAANNQGRNRFRDDAEAIWRAAFAAVEPSRLVRRSVVREGNGLRIGGRTFDLAGYERVFLIAFGKAAWPMSEALAAILGDRLTSGLVAAPGTGGCSSGRRQGESFAAGAGRRVPGLEYYEASHPSPDGRSVARARRAIEVAQNAGANDLVLVAVSGGGSSLLSLPAEGITLGEKRGVADGLLRAGASIHELNAVRKHLSAVKGGRLSQAAFPAAVVTLAISDVVGDDPGTIGSGPTHWDASTFAGAREVLERYGLWATAPASVRSRLERGAAGEIAESLKEGDPVFARAFTAVVGDNMTALRAAKAEADARDFETVFLTSSDGGEARKAARNYAAFLAEMACSAVLLPRPLCLLAGGELAVTVKGKGRGGRNTEFVLAALLEMAKENTERLDWLILSLGTDGVDGPTDAAGAFVDGTTVQRAATAQLNPDAALADNDSYSFFACLGDHFRCGPTGTNVMDIKIALLPAVSGPHQ